MNSGLTAIPRGGKDAPAAPRAMAGSSTFSVVPGTTVLRSTTVNGVRRARRARPICQPTRSTAVASGRPLTRLGVPTQISARSVAATASSTETVARSRFLETASASSSPNPSSTSGGAP